MKKYFLFCERNDQQFYMKVIILCWILLYKAVSAIIHSWTLLFKSNYLLYFFTTTQTVIQHDLLIDWFHRHVNQYGILWLEVIKYRIVYVYIYIFV